jgi:hypothetical protein
LIPDPKSVENVMKSLTIARTLGLLLGSSVASVAIAQSPLPAITEQEGHAIAVDAYVYLYPLLTIGRDPQAAHEYGARHTP